MSAHALITIATRHQSHYERLKSSEVAKFDDFLKKMDRDIRRHLGGEDITQYTRTRLEKQLTQVRGLLTGTMDEYAAVWRDGVEASALYEADFEVRSLAKVVDGVEFTMPSDKQITAAVFNSPLGNIGGADGGALLDPFLEDMSARTVKRIEGAIRLGYAQGQTTAQILQRVRGTRAAGFRDGIMANVKRDAEAITRTALQHAASQARNAVWAENDSVIKSVRITATLDDRTSTICQSLDGHEYPLDEGPRPPFHVNCRTTTIAVLNSEFSFLSAGRTRSARDPETGAVESVSGKQTYYDWLKGQPANVQDSIIGDSRGALLRNGGISSERFAELQLGKNFEPLTLVQMRELDPVAFERAGL